MSKYIALSAAVIILCTFVLQYGREQINHYNITEFQTIVYSAKEEAKQKGYFTPEIIEKMKNDIMDKFEDINDSEIVVDVTITPKYRTNSFDDRELISYKVGIPIKKIIAANDLWGVSDSDNEMIYYVKGDTVSEALSSIEVE